MDEFKGLTEDEILMRIECGESINQIAQSIKSNRSVLWKWLEADEKRSQRARESRMKSAMAFDELAENEIRGSADQFDLAKAKELAIHYRWRSSKIAPRDYGDKVQNEITGALTVEKVVREVIDPVKK